MLISDMQRGLFIVRPERTAPLAVSDFTARPSGESVELGWTMGDGVERFMVEHARAGTWATLGTVEAGEQTRFRADRLAAGEHTFRLRAVDTSG